ncbi:hypothetical protein R3W88_030616 [Solanum pinnatisectum]|uniref:Uncharacterized protein n=1 Tax=Solanum pinnatisectum TaxID=50273 RepID=A0AAV9LKJ5_9SOLN|nr:hypothetical protein R3W88_030616 [Solanum pinnatisectum]
MLENEHMALQLKHKQHELDSTKPNISFNSAPLSLDRPVGRDQLDAARSIMTPLVICLVRRSPMMSLDLDVFPSMLSCASIFGVEIGQSFPNSSVYSKL